MHKNTLTAAAAALECRVFLSFAMCHLRGDAPCNLLLFSDSPVRNKMRPQMAASEAVGRGGVDSPDLTGTSRDVRRCGVVEDLITRSWLDLITASVSSGDASSAAVNPAATKRNDASCARN